MLWYMILFHKVLVPFSRCWAFKTYDLDPLWYCKILYVSRLFSYDYLQRIGFSLNTKYLANHASFNDFQFAFSHSLQMHYNSILEILYYYLDLWCSAKVHIHHIQKSVSKRYEIWKTIKSLSREHIVLWWTKEAYSSIF